MTKLKVIPQIKRYWWPHPQFFIHRHNPFAHKPWRPYVDITVDYKYEITGHLNPAECALDFLKSAYGNDVQIDELSFKRIAKTLPPYSGPGFIVRDLKDLNKLCEIGNFAVFFNCGVIQAVPILDRMTV